MVDEETRSKAYRLCKEFLGGAWKKLKYEDFDIGAISGGLSNLLYSCSIGNDMIETHDGEPRKVLLRIYGQIIHDHPEMVVKDSVVFALLAERQMGPKLYGVFTGGRVEEYIKSYNKNEEIKNLLVYALLGERKIGPKLYGIFQGGRVEEYIPSRHLTTSELRKPNISMECARVMAHFHQMQMPLCKEPTWLFDTIDGYMRSSLEVLNSSNMDRKKEELLDTYRGYDLQKELNILKNILKQIDSPVVFCHNDMQEGNILIFGESPFSQEVQLQPIDFEYSSYNYRGFDFGNHFSEWCYNYHEVDEYPFYRAKLEDYPDKERQLQFIQTYISEIGLDKEPDFNAKETEEKIILEANAYALASHFLWGLWSIVQYNISTIQFGYLEYGISRFEAYFQQKQQLPKHLLSQATTSDSEEISQFDLIVK